MTIQKKIFYSILIIFTIVYSLSTWFYYIHFEKALKDSYKNQVSQTNEYIYQDIKKTIKQYNILLKNLNKDGDISSLYDHVPWLASLAKKIVRKNFEITFKEYAQLKEVEFYQNDSLILKLNSKNSNSPENSFIIYEEKLNFENAKVIFKIDLIEVIKYHLVENKISDLAFIYLQNKKGTWLVKKDSIEYFKDINESKKQIKIHKTKHLISKASFIENFSIRSLISLEKMQKGIKDIFWKFFILYLITALSIFFIARYLASFITKPLNSLELASNKIMARDFSKIEYENNDETKNAILAFNLMSEEIKSFTDNLQKEVDLRTKELKEINKTLDKKIKKEVAKNQEQERLIFFQSKLATMGETINIIAHQWRQPLTIVSAHLSKIQFRIKYKNECSQEEVLETINDAQDGLKHISSTITLFQSYLNPKEITEDETFEINAAVDNSIKLFESILKKFKIEIKKDMPEYIKIKGNQDYFIQVLMVLLNNAKDAILRNTKKDAYIKLKLVEEKDTIIFSIEDNGGGIKIKENIFDPYITGKSSTGLGLFIANNIITSTFKGKITATNTKNGALFSISFPI